MKSLNVTKGRQIVLAVVIGAILVAAAYIADYGLVGDSLRSRYDVPVKSNCGTAVAHPGVFSLTARLTGFAYEVEVPDAKLATGTVSYLGVIHQDSVDQCPLL